MLNRLKIGKKFIVSFGVMIFLMAILTVVAIYSYASITQTTNDVVNGIAASKRANDIIDSANMMRRHFLVYLVNHDPKTEESFKEELKKTLDITNDIIEKTTFEENRKHAKAVLSVLKKTGNAENEFRAMDAQLEDAKNAYYSMADNVADLIEKTYAIVQNKIVASEKKENDKATTVEEDKVFLAESLLRTLILLEGQRIARLKFLYAYDDDARQAAMKSMNAVNEKFHFYVDQIQTSLPEGEARQYFEQALPVFQKLNELGTNHSNVVHSQADKQRELMEYFKETIDVSQGMLHVTAADSQKDLNVQKSVIAFSRELVCVTAIAAVVIALLLGFTLTRSVAGGISGIVNLFKRITKEGDTDVLIDDKYLKRSDEVGDLSQQAKEIIHELRSVTELGQSLSRGDWTSRVKIKSNKDEMNKNLSAMLEQVNDVLNQVRNAVQQVSSGAGQVAATSESLSQGATESAASLEEITSSMAEMGSQTHQNAENAAEATHLAKDASDAAGAGQSMMKQMIHSMEQITKNSQDVQSVIKVIDDISFQTNLLALNAAVEAARAGIHGKGFAVVAEEVRNLAARCAKAAGETTQMIENNNRQIHEGAGIAQKTAEMLDQIVSHVSSTAKLINEIATASNEQAQGVSQVTQALQQIDAVTQQNTANAEESASTSHEMNSHATKLQQVVARFKLRSTKTNDGISVGGRSSGAGKYSSNESGNALAANAGSSGYNFGARKNAANVAKSANAESGAGRSNHWGNDGWDGNNAATAVLDSDPDYNFKLDDSEFGK
ncbi:MAG: methyl-accepting chemotaxis protein [Planctomycetaceae bacterium]|jgi:methyl-accepting chemotaxis protein|nr:methyl-accepting chemotaxis protein [Planctomycetaceae bacterium]